MHHKNDDVLLSFPFLRKPIFFRKKDQKSKIFYDLSFIIEQSWNRIIIWHIWCGELCEHRFLLAVARSTVKGAVSRDFLFLVFFMNQFPPSPMQSLPLRPFRIFSKIAEIFASQGAPPVSTTPAANFSTIFANVVDTGGKPWAANISANFRKNSKRP
jgi:hypothetical protein